MLTPAQERKIGLLSDTVLYPEAVAFVRRLVRDEDCDPLPTSQAAGLLSIASSFKYGELSAFIIHQRDRNWPSNKSDIRTFYTELEKYFSVMQKKRLKDEFHLPTDNPNTKESKEESDELMARLAREFIQHTVAENSLFARSR